MPALLIRHRVTDYAVWKRVFDDEAPTRWSNGCRGEQVFRNSADPGETMILLTWDDLMRARLYVQSDELKEFMERAGLADNPDLWILEQMDDVAP